MSLRGPCSRLSKSAVATQPRRATALRNEAGRFTAGEGGEVAWIFRRSMRGNEMAQLDIKDKSERFLLVPPLFFFYLGLCLFLLFYVQLLFQYFK